MAFQVSGDTVIDQNQSITSPKITLEGTSASESILSGLLNGDSKLEIKADGKITSSNNIVANAFISPNNGNITRLLIQNETGDVIILDKDGNATFDGSVESKNNFFVKAQANDQTCFRVTDGSGSTIRTNLRGDGGAEFASTVKIGNPSNPEIELTGSGNATFAGSINAQNTILVNRTGSTQTAFQATLSGVTQVDITAGGAASFGAQNLSSDGGAGTAITGDGRMSLQFPSGGGAGVEMFSLYSGTSKTISMFSGGSATFAGSVDVGGLTVNGAPVTGDVDLSGYDTSAEVDQKIANLVGTASSTLDTLGEIADALSDNQSVATSITVQLGLKANTSSLANVATSGSYNDLTNKPSIPTHTSSLTNNSGFITSNNSTFSSSYYEFGNGTGSVSNDGSWNARLNLAGSSHARLDVTSVSDGIITSIYSHTGNGAGRIGTSSDHPLKLMVGGNNYATLSTSGVLDTFSQGTLWGSSNDGSGSGLDADLLDGLHASSFLRLDQDNTITKNGIFTLSSTYGDWGFKFHNSNGTNNTVYMNHPTHGMHIRNDSSTTNSYLLDVYAANGNRFQVRGADAYTTINGNAVWHAGNDGSGSGLDADLLDGFEASAFVKQNESATLDVLGFSGVGGDSGNGNQSYAIYQAGGAWSNPYPDLVISYHTGIRIGGNYNYGGTRFYSDSPDSSGVTELFSVGNGNFDVAVTNTLTVGGNVSASGNVTAYASDRRLKENFKHIESPLEKIQKLNGYTFDWIDGVKELGFEPSSQKDDIGLIAQEVQEVMPQATAPAPFDQEWDTDVEKYVSKSGEDYLTIQYEKLVPLLVEAIKDQQKQIDELNKKLGGN